MTTEFERNLEKYAEVILKVGVNLQRGQRLLIGVTNPINRGTPIELASFVRKIVMKAYQMGARFVEVLWNDPKMQLIRFQHAPRNSFEEVASWRMEAELEYAKNGDALLAIVAQDPELFNGQDSDLLMKEGKAVSICHKPVLDLLVKNAFNWNAIAAPVEGWADKVFPELAPDERKAKMWETIFEVCRINHDDPILLWQKHINDLNARCTYLNQKQYIALKLEASGTNLNIGLPKNHIWLGGNMTSQNNIDFVANIPTEEVFTLPHKDKTEGVVAATKPLYHNGCYIEDFHLEFSRGKVVKATAAKGQGFLDEFINYDDGACQLGEVALIPNISPISQSGLLFYNTLFDENASCHIALGSAFKSSIENGEAMSEEEFMAVGGNNSILHMDFMIGSEKLNVYGILNDGSPEPIMQNGEWAFNV